MKSRILHFLAAFLMVCGLLALTVTQKVTREIPLQKIGADSGYGYAVSLKKDRLFLTRPGDSDRNPNQSNLLLMENGRPLGPAHSMHEAIRKIGQGRFSHWGDTLLFSASDNGDPRTNARAYSFTMEVQFSKWVGCLLLLAGFIIVFCLDQAPFALLLSAMRNNGRFFRALIAVLWRPAFVFVALSIAVWAYQAKIPVDERNEMMETTVEKIIARQQYDRAKTAGWNADLLFFGDSSCLMGIDFSALQDELQLPVKSLCTIAYMGPRGWRMLLAKQMASSGKPHGRIVFVMHPVGFKRENGWDDGWLSLLAGFDSEKPEDSTAQHRVAMATQNRLLAKVIFQPMPGLMGAYYGNPAAFSNAVMKTGGAIDPSTGLNPALYAEQLKQSAAAAPAAKEAAPDPKGESPFAPNQLFAEALADLNRGFDELGLDRKKVFIAITPIPESQCDEPFRRDREKAISIIAKELHLGKNQFIELPAGMPNFKFSTGTHLNPYGRKEYTNILAKSLSLHGALAHQSNKP